MSEPITKKERYLAYLAGDKTVTLPQPVTREERYLAAMCGMDVELPQAVTRVDRLMDKIVTQSTTSLQPLKSVSIIENGTKNVMPDDGYDGMRNVQIDVAVPDSVHVYDFQVDQNGNYITDALSDFTSANELANMLLNALSDVFITLDFDINKGETNLFKGMSLNYNFSKLMNYLDKSPDNMYFQLAEPRVLIASSIKITRGDNKWMIGKDDLDLALEAIKSGFEDNSHITGTEIILNNICMCEYIPDF